LTARASFAAVRERESLLQRLAAAFDRMASARTGMCAVISGQAGIGKTSLVQTFACSLPAETRPLQCGCAALFTRGPFGPVRVAADG